MILVDTFVAGLPRTKGSLAKRPNGSLYDSVVDSGKWRALMAGAVRDAYRAWWARRYCTGPYRGCSHGAHLPCGRPEPHPGAAEVAATFLLPCDPLAYAAGDLDKLARNLLDALGTHSKNPRYNGGVIVDDNQVILLHVRKVEAATAGLRPGVSVTVGTVDNSAMHGRLIP